METQRPGLCFLYDPFESVKSIWNILDICERKCIMQICAAFVKHLVVFSPSEKWKHAWSRHLVLYSSATRSVTRHGLVCNLSVLAVTSIITLAINHYRPRVGYCHISHRKVNSNLFLGTFSSGLRSLTRSLTSLVPSHTHTRPIFSDFLTCAVALSHIRENRSWSLWCDWVREGDRGEGWPVKLIMVKVGSH